MIFSLFVPGCGEVAHAKFGRACRDAFVVVHSTTDEISATVIAGEVDRVFFSSLNLELG